MDKLALEKHILCKDMISTKKTTGASCLAWYQFFKIDLASFLSNLEEFIIDRIQTKTINILTIHVEDQRLARREQKRPKNKIKQARKLHIEPNLDIHQ